MLRLLIAVLLVANLAFWAWTQGWLVGWVGGSPLGERDPQRLQREIEPASVVVLPSAAVGARSGVNGAAVASPVSLPASAVDVARRGACIETGPFDSVQIEAAEAALAQAMPAGNWSRVVGPVPAVYAVYMGRFTEPDGLQRKQAELRRLRVAYEPAPAGSELSPGLVLARHASEAEAESALEQMNSRGVRTARVVQISPARQAWRLRIDGAEPGVVAQALALRVDALGRGFGPCVQPTPGLLAGTAADRGGAAAVAQGR